MSDPTWHPHCTDTAPAQEPRCPPCNGNCLQGSACDADPMIQTSAGGLLLMAVLIVAVLAVIVLLVWAR